MDLDGKGELQSGHSGMEETESAGGNGKVEGGVKPPGGTEEVGCRIFMGRTVRVRGLKKVGR